MNWKLSPKIESILEKGKDGAGISKSDAVLLLQSPLHGKETYALMQTADALSRSTFKGKAENHFHIGVNVAPCPLNCMFCSLTKEAGIFTQPIEFSEEQIVEWSVSAEKAGADALNIMTTGTFTRDAKQEAVRDGVPPIELVDGEMLLDMFESLQLGLKPRTTYDVDHDFFDDFR